MELPPYPDVSLRLGLSTRKDHPSIRGQSAPVANGLDRPLPDASHRLHLPFAGLLCKQSVYNLGNPTAPWNLESRPPRHYGLGIIHWSPLAGGLLGGATGKQATGRRSGEEFAETVEAKRPKLGPFEALCRNSAKSPPASAWRGCCPIRSWPRRSSGCGRMDQLTGAVRATEIRLSSEMLECLNRNWLGLSGEVPNAYLW